MSSTKLKDKARSGRGGRAFSPGENGREVFFGPTTAPNSFKRALDSLHDLMELPVVSPDSAVSYIVKSMNIQFDSSHTCCL